MKIYIVFCMYVWCACKCVHIYGIVHMCAGTRTYICMWVHMCGAVRVCIQVPEHMFVRVCEGQRLTKGAH